MRIGIGYDIHQFESEEKPLVLGGVRIPNCSGLKGHSDGDCLLHAISDAIFGALGDQDIGEHFSDKDAKNKNIDSSIILKKANDLAKNAGYKIGNIDTIIIAEKPNLKAFKQSIKESVANILGVKDTQVSIKAKTNEKLDAIGSEKAIAAHAIVLLLPL